MPVIAEVHDASTALQAPPEVDAGAYIEKLRDSAGWMLGTADKIAQKFFHVSVIQQCVEPFAGDWTQLQTAQGGWTNMGAALQATAKNYEAATGQLQEVWEGTAAAAARGRLLDVAELHHSQAQGCAMISEQLGCIIEVAQATGELVASVLSILNDFLTKLAIQAAIPVIGWFGAAFNIAAHAGKFWRLINRVNTAVNRLIKTIVKVMRVIALVQKVFKTMSNALGLGSRAVGAYGYQSLDEAAGVQFGVG